MTDVQTIASWIPVFIVIGAATGWLLRNLYRN